MKVRFNQIRINLIGKDKIYFFYLNGLEVLEIWQKEYVELIKNEEFFMNFDGIKTILLM